MPVGFSTDDIQDMSLNEKIKFFSEFGDAMELWFDSQEELKNFEPTQESIDILNNFNYVSIHAPTNITYDDNEQTNEILKKLEILCNKLPIKGIVVHPNDVADFSILNSLPILLENMDAEKNTGTTLTHFEEYKKYNFNFVLDLQHVYEHDPTMQLAKDFIQLMGDRLQHLQVSGCTKDSNHHPVFSADNKEAITKILELKLPVPIILEGLFTNKEDVAQELRFIQII